MPYVPRPTTIEKCAFCQNPFESRHASRKYCSNSCNVQASYARTGYRSEGRLTRAELERALAQMVELTRGLPTPAPAAATKPAKKITTPAPPTPAAKAAAKAPTKKPAAKAAVKPAPKTAKTAKTATKPAPPAPTAKAAAKARFAQLAQKASDKEKSNQDHYEGRDPREIYRR